MEFPFNETTDFSFDNRVVTLGPRIGQGEFSVVHLGKYFGDFVAVKKQTRQGNTIENYLLRELSVLKNIHHDCIMGYIGAWNEVNDIADGVSAVYIVTEFCQGGDLLNLLLSKDIQTIGWRFRMKIATEAASAIRYLHEHCILHRDIKSSNILLDSSWTCKLTDFGMARELPTDCDESERLRSSRNMTICGTNEYMAPEMLFDEPYNAAVDVFSFGMVLLEIITRQQAGRNGFACRGPRTKFQLDLDELTAALPEEHPPSMGVLAAQCLSFEKDERPTAEDVHEWLLDLWQTTPEDSVADPPMPPPPDSLNNEASLEAFHAAPSATTTISPTSTTVLNDVHTEDANMKRETVPVKPPKKGFSRRDVNGNIASSDGQLPMDVRNELSLEIQKRFSIGSTDSCLSAEDTVNSNEVTKSAPELSGAVAPQLITQFNNSMSKPQLSSQASFLRMKVGSPDVDSVGSVPAGQTASAGVNSKPPRPSVGPRTGGVRRSLLGDMSLESDDGAGSPIRLKPNSITGGDGREGGSLPKTPPRSPEINRDKSAAGSDSSRRASGEGVARAAGKVPTPMSVEKERPPMKAGPLLKRNTKGLRYWTSAWFVLTDSHLKWYRSLNDHELRGQIPLRGVVLKKTKEFRWQILDVKPEGDGIHDSKLFNRELSARTEREMEEWMDSIQKVIDALASSHLNSDPEQSINSKSSPSGNSTSSPKTTGLYLYSFIPKSLQRRFSGTKTSSSTNISTSTSTSTAVTSDSVNGPPTLIIPNQLHMSTSVPSPLHPPLPPSSSPYKAPPTRSGASTSLPSTLQILNSAVKIRESELSSHLLLHSPSKESIEVSVYPAIAQPSNLNRVDSTCSSAVSSSGATVGTLAGVALEEDSYETMEDWLRALRLEQYIPLFHQVGIYDTKTIHVGGGLTTQLLDKLQITHPIHRRVLITAAVTSFSDKLKIMVPEWKKDESSKEVEYKVVARWRFHRSSVMYKEEDILELDRSATELLEQLDNDPRYAVIASSSSSNSSLTWASRKPTLPWNVVRNMDESSVLPASELEQYLQRISYLLSDTPAFPSLLHHLGMRLPDPTPSQLAQSKSFHHGRALSSCLPATNPLPGVTPHSRSLSHSHSTVTALRQQQPHYDANLALARILQSSTDPVLKDKLARSKLRKSGGHQRLVESSLLSTPEEVDGAPLRSQPAVETSRKEPLNLSLEPLQYSNGGGIGKKPMSIVTQPADCQHTVESSPTANHSRVDEIKKKLGQALPIVPKKEK